MICSGEEKLGMPSAKGWRQIMGERLLVSANNNSTTTTTTSCSNNSSNISSCSSTPTSTTNSSKNNNMIHASSTTASTPAAGARVMDRPSAQDHHAALKCPRCDSSNTKFCYYNNYSLSQPRHFCKACKRYWTRGGTLRNVPVGGGCRKNKRVKKPSLASGMGASSDPHNSHSLLPSNPLTSVSLPSTSAHLDASMFYALQSAASQVDMSLALPSLANNMQFPSCTTAFDLQPQLSALGLGFASNEREDEYIEQLHQLPASSTAISLMNDCPLFGSSLSSATAASLIVSSLRQPKKLEDNQQLFPYGELQASGMSGSLGMMKEVKLEVQNAGAINSNNSSSCTEWQFPSENSSGAFGSAAATTVAPNSDYYLYWNAAIGGGWPDAGNLALDLS